MVPTPIISSTNGSTYSKVVSKRIISSFAQRVTRNENIAKKTNSWRFGRPVAQKWSTIVPKLAMCALSETLRRVGALNGTPRQGH